MTAGDLLGCLGLVLMVLLAVSVGLWTLASHWPVLLVAVLVVWLVWTAVWVVTHPGRSV